MKFSFCHCLFKTIKASVKPKLTRQKKASTALDPILNDKARSAEADAKVHEGHKKFIRIDRVRTFLSEVPAFLCFLGASLAYLQL